MQRKEVSIGDRFGYLTVIEMLEAKNYHSMVKCKCDCGNIKDMRVTHIVNRPTGSCGCQKSKRKINTIIIKETHAEILVGEEIIFIDVEDIEKVKAYTWLVHDKRPRTGDHLPIANVILDVPKGAIVDHINNNAMINFKSNLRVATSSQNGANRMPSNPNGFKGITRNGSNWAAQIKVGGKRSHLGTFKTKEEAAYTYDIAAKKYFGEFAQLNFS